jgi:hypothetical protein
MTEKQWLLATSMHDVHIYYLARKQFRKWRLFGCGCARRILHVLNDRIYDVAVETVELFADGDVRWEVVKDARKVIFAARRKLAKSGAPFEIDSAIDVLSALTSKEPNHTILTSSNAACVFGTLSQPEFDAGYAEEERKQLPIARDIFGNPFRPVTFDPAWLTGTAVALAKTMYDARDFAAMPILADALEEAGCDVPDVLSHCRDPKGVHVRGCWVVDLVLGKS